MSKHLHTYERVKERKNYYRCIHPDCTHYQHRTFLRNKRARCWVCNEPFVITSHTLQLAKLRCGNCRHNRSSKLAPTVQSIVDKLDKLNIGE